MLIKKKEKKRKRGEGERLCACVWKRQVGHIFASCAKKFNKKKICAKGINGLGHN